MSEAWVQEPDVVLMSAAAVKTGASCYANYTSTTVDSQDNSYEIVDDLVWAVRAERRVHEYIPVYVII